MEYPKIDTVYERDPVTFKVKPGVLKNPIYDLLKRWEFTEKIDGTNIRVIWQDGKLSFGGRTDSAQIHADLVRWLYDHITPEMVRSVFPDTNAVIYGEGYGAGIQKGGILYSPTKKLIVFDVLVGGRWWLNWVNTFDVATRLGLDVVPYLGAMTLEDATEKVRAGFKTALGDQTGSAEGLVGRPEECLFDKRGHRLILKLKTKDFANTEVGR